MILKNKVCEGPVFKVLLVRAVVDFRQNPHFVKTDFADRNSVRKNVLLVMKKMFSGFELKNI